MDVARVMSAVGHVRTELRVMPAREELTFNAAATPVAAAQASARGPWLVAGGLPSQVRMEQDSKKARAHSPAGGLFTPPASAQTNVRHVSFLAWFQLEALLPLHNSAGTAEAD